MIVTPRGVTSGRIVFVRVLLAFKGAHATVWLKEIKEIREIMEACAEWTAH